MNFEEFAAYFVNALLPEYHAYKGPDGKAASPMELYESHEKARQETVSWATLSIAMSDKCERTVRTDGVHVDNVCYWDDAMAGIVGARVEVLRFRHMKGFATIIKDNTCICTARTAERYKLLGEDDEKVNRLTALQARTRKEKMAALRLPMERVRIIDDMAMEIPTLAQGSTITSLVHERAYRESQEAMARDDRRAETRRKVGKALRTKYEAAGLALLQMPDAE